MELQTQQVIKFLNNQEETIKILREMDEDRVKQVQKLENKCKEYKSRIQELEQELQNKR